MSLTSSVHLILTSNPLAYIFPWQLWGHAVLKVDETAYQKKMFIKPKTLEVQPYESFIEQISAPLLFGVKRKIDTFELKVTPEETARLTQALKRKSTEPRLYNPFTNNCATILRDALVVATKGSEHPVHNPWYGFLNDCNPFGYAPGDLKVQLRRDHRLVDEQVKPCGAFYLLASKLKALCPLFSRCSFNKAHKQKTPLQING